MTVTAYALDLKTGNLGTFDATGITALYRDPATGKLCVSSEFDIAAPFTSTTARSTGTWAKRFVFDKFESFGFLQVQSDFTDADGTTAAAVTVNIYNASGTLLSTTSVTSREAVRLASFKERELTVEVVSKARVSEVTLASTAQELKAA